MTGSNTALSNWTMNDLLGISGNETKRNNVSNLVASPTKRASLRPRAQQQMTEQSSASQINHKRPSTHDTSINKRLKSNSTVSAFSLANSRSTTIGHIQQQSFPLQSQETRQHQKTPHLLQHLMAPSPDRVRKYTGPANNKAATNGKSTPDPQWSCAVGFDESKIQSSDSVLKNLLVSGCDISAGYVCQVPMRLRKLAKA